MEKKRKLSYERGKCVELPQAKLKKIFLQTKQINGSREDGRVALNAALNAFIQDVVQGTVAIAIEKSLTKEEIKRNPVFIEDKERLIQILLEVILYLIDLLVRIMALRFLSKIKHL